MKRHDVSNHGPDTRYPAHERSVVLWLDGGEWARGWFDEESGRWSRSGIVGPIDGVLAWSDPTEPESAEPFAWALTSNLFGGPRPLTAYNKRQLAEDVAAAIDPSLQVVPLYANPPDTAAVMRQAAEALATVAERVAVISNLPMQEQDNMLSANMRTIAKMAERDARAALSALRGAIGGV